MTPWIQVYSNLIRHPKTTNLADELKLTCGSTSPNVVAAGMLVSLWLWASQNVPTGDLSGCSDRAIAEAAEWKKKPGTFVTALIKCRWLDADRKLHDWEEYETLLNDSHELQKEQTKRRVQKHRERKRNANKQNLQAPCNGDCNVTAPECNGDCNGDCNVTYGACNAPTIPNHTIPNHTVTLTGAADGDARAGEAEPELLAQIGLKPGEYPGVTRERVLRTIRLTQSLFARYRKTEPGPWDYRKVFTHDVSRDSAELLAYAFEVAAQEGKADGWQYIDGILKQLTARGIYTVSEAREWDIERPDKGGET